MALVIEKSEKEVKMQQVLGIIMVAAGMLMLSGLMVKLIKAK